LQKLGRIAPQDRGAIASLLFEIRIGNFSLPAHLLAERPSCSGDENPAGGGVEGID
jgi:hypothetical protein